MPECNPLKSVKNMKPQTIIDNYCRLNGVAVPVADRSETRYFVAISSDGVRVLYLRNAPKLLGRVVCEAMKRGTVLLVENGWVTPLTWENWGLTWERLFAPKARNKTPRPERARSYRSEMFESMRQQRAPKKPRKRGFERTETANRAIELLSGPLSRVRVERI